MTKLLDDALAAVRGLPLDEQRGMAKAVRMTLGQALARESTVNRAKHDATTEDDVRRHMAEDGDDYDEDIRDEDVISPAFIRERLGMTQEQFANAIRVPVATLRNWEQNRV